MERDKDKKNARAIMTQWLLNGSLFVGESYQEVLNKYRSNKHKCIT